MPTLNPRINVVLEPSLYSQIKSIAKKEHISMSLVARDLIKEACELYEDAHFSEIAKVREKSFSYKKAKSHKDIWG